MENLVNRSDENKVSAKRKIPTEKTPPDWVGETIAVETGAVGVERPRPSSGLNQEVKDKFAMNLNSDDNPSKE